MNDFVLGPSIDLFSLPLAEVRGGIDYGFTGEVKKIDVSRIRERLDRDSIVIVSNMRYSSIGEVLNCKYSLYSPHRIHPKIVVYL